MIEYEKIFNNGLKLEVEDNGFVVRDDDNFIVRDERRPLFSKSG